MTGNLAKVTFTATLRTPFRHRCRNFQLKRLREIDGICFVSSQRFLHKPHQFLNIVSESFVRLVFSMALPPFTRNINTVKGFELHVLSGIKGRMQKVSKRSLGSVKGVFEVTQISATCGRNRRQSARKTTGRRR